MCTLVDVGHFNRRLFRLKRSPLGIGSNKSKQVLLLRIFLFVILAHQFMGEPEASGAALIAVGANADERCPRLRD